MNGETDYRSLADWVGVINPAPTPAPEKTPSSYALPGPYITRLNQSDETAFQQWVKQSNIPFDSSDTADYDMRGFWKALISGDPRATMSFSSTDERIHFPDVWKTPYHKTFSNESIYATKDAPHWDGHKLIDKDGKVIIDETTPAQPEPHPTPVQPALPAPQPRGAISLDPDIWRKSGREIDPMIIAPREEMESRFQQQEQKRQKLPTPIQVQRDTKESDMNALVKWLAAGTGSQYL